MKRRGRGHRAADSGSGFGSVFLVGKDWMREGRADEGWMRRMIMRMHDNDAYVIRHWTDSIYIIYTLGIHHYAQQLERATYLFACFLARLLAI